MPYRIVLAFAVPALGCATLNGGGGSGAPIQTDRQRYVVQDTAGLASLTIHMTYRNATGKRVYLPTCRGPQPPRLQKQVGDTWVVAFAPNVLACEGIPIEVPAGGSYDYAYRILAGMPGSSFAPRWAVSEIPGTYRVLWEIFTDVAGDPRRPSATRNPLPVDQEVSNTFTLAR
jgi:hypothetical protein